MFHAKLYLRGFAVFHDFRNNITSCTVQGDPVTSDIWPSGKGPKGSCEKAPPLPDNKVWGVRFRLLLLGAADGSLLQTLRTVVARLISAPTSAQDSLTARFSVCPAVQCGMSLPPSLAQLLRHKRSSMTLRTAAKSRVWDRSPLCTLYVPDTVGGRQLWEAVLMERGLSRSLGFYTIEDIVRSKREHIYPVSSLLFLEGSDS